MWCERRVRCDLGRRPEWQLDVYGQRYDANGNPVGGNFKVNDDAGSTDQYSSAVAVNKYGEFIVVWTDDRAARMSLCAALRRERKPLAQASG